MSHGKHEITKEKKKADVITLSSVFIGLVVSFLCNTQSLREARSLASSAEENIFELISGVFLLSIMSAGNTYIRYQINHHFQKEEKSETEQEASQHEDPEAYDHQSTSHKDSLWGDIDDVNVKAKHPETNGILLTPSPSSNLLQTGSFRQEIKQSVVGLSPLQYVAVGLSMVSLTLDKAGGISLGTTRFLKDIFNVNTEEFIPKLCVFIASTAFGFFGSLADARTNKNIMIQKNQKSRSPHSETTENLDKPEESSSLSINSEQSKGDCLTTSSTFFEAVNNIINNYQLAALFVALITAEDIPALTLGAIFASFAIGSIIAHQKFNQHHEHVHGGSYSTFNDPGHHQHDQHHSALTCNQKVFLGCDYITHSCEDATPIMLSLDKTTKNIYVKGAMFFAATSLGCLSAIANLRNCTHVFEKENHNHPTSNNTGRTSSH